MLRHRHAGLLGTFAVGLFVSVAALPTGAASAGPTSTAAAETATCTAARAAHDEYRVSTMVPLAAEWDARADGVDSLVAAAVAEVASASVAAQEASDLLASAERDVDRAEADLALAQEDGAPERVTAAEEALAAAEEARELAAQSAAASTADHAEAETDLLGLQAEQAETRGLADFLGYVSVGRDFETEAQLVEYLADLRSAIDLDDVVEYADLVEDFADACFVYDDPEQEKASRTPVAGAATPVQARASFTG